MPKVNEYAVGLRPFLFQGVLFKNTSSEQAIAECPFCGKMKFYVVEATGQWDCKVCGEKGNTVMFLRKLWEQSMESGTSDTDWGELAESRGYANGTTLEKWGVCRSIVDPESWLVPGYGLGKERRLDQLYKWKPGGQLLCGPKYVASNNQEVGHALHGLNLWDPKKPEVWICEGWGDALTLWETVQNNPLYQYRINVVAVPGANVFLETWAQYFKGKKIVLLYDSDHPREVKGKILRTGWDATLRTTGILLGAGVPRDQIQYLQWGPEGYDPQQKDGYDIRDLLSSRRSLGESGQETLQWVADNLRSTQEEEAQQATTLVRKSKGLPTPTLCKSWGVLRRAWQTAFHWTDGHDRALSVMLASIISTKLVGDQLWVRVISPASTGKTQLCEAVSTAVRYVYAKDTFTGIVSGLQTDKTGERDLSVVPMIDGMTLVIKDADTVIQNPARAQILSQFRALYDRAIRTQFKNDMSHNYEGLSTTVIICGTDAIYTIDRSELGERYLDCRIMGRIDEKLERNIAWQVINRVRRNGGAEVNGKAETMFSPELCRAMSTTGGYVEYLRENASQLVGSVKMSDEVAERCLDLAGFVSHLRARPSIAQDESESREMTSRLISQLGRLSLCLAAVLGKDEVDEEVMRRVHLVAIDTAHGKSLDTVKALYEAGEEGEEVPVLCRKTSRRRDHVLDLLVFLAKPNISVVESFTPTTEMYINGEVKEVETGTARWRLTPKMSNLYKKVVTGAKSG